MGARTWARNIANALVSITNGRWGRSGTVSETKRSVGDGIIARRQIHVKDALDQLDKHGVQVGSSATYASLLQWCGNAKTIAEGRLVHEHIIRNGYGHNTYLGNCLIQMYRKCGSLDDATSVFNAMPRKDIVSWNAMISAYAQNGCSKNALDLYHRMDSEGMEPDCVTFVSVLGACSNLLALAEGKAVHARFEACGMDRDVVLDTALLNMYAKCGDLHEARRLFDRMPKKNVVSWTAMVTAYAQHGHPREALDIYQKMDKEAVEPNRITFLSVLGVCSTLGALKAGEAVHARIVARKMQGDVPLGNALINMYAKCGSIEQAKKTFDEMTKKDVVSWTSMIMAYTQNLQGREALGLYQKMDVEPNFVTFISVLGACSSLGALEDGKAVHARIIASGVQPDVALETSLVAMYANCGSLEDARTVFDSMKRRNLVSWNAMIGAYASYADGIVAFDLFKRMEVEGIKACSITFIALLGACANVGALRGGVAIHERVLAAGMLPDDVLETALLNMYAKCHRPQDARRVFERMQHRDVVSWTAIIAAYAQQGHYKESMELYKRMVAEAVEPNSITLVSILGACSTPEALPDGRAIHARIAESGRMQADIVQNALLNMYAKCGSLEDARKAFEQMERKSVVSWNTMMAAYAQLGHGREAIELYKRMESEGTEADHTTLVTVLGACSSVGALDEGRAFHSSSQWQQQQQQQPSNNVVVENALVNMYAKCGALEDAKAIFETMQHKNLVSWTAVIVGYAQHGHAEVAIELYKRMHLDGAEPDSITFMSILIACSHAGLVSNGRECFISMRADCGIEPLVEHYVCLMDLLGRAGWLDEAEELIQSMPFQPEALAWMTLLGACKVQNDIERASRVAELVFELNPDEIGSHVLLSNIYVAQARLKDSVELLDG